MLVTLRLYLADGRTRHISYEVDESDESSAEEILLRMSDEGRVRLGDREQYPLHAVQRVELVPEHDATAPEWFEPGKPADARLRDEDVASALRQQHRSERPESDRD